tara:strand:+ start:38424 stop:38711 length:288 start_codon:yes stop_codon:yes gene_type:complete
MLNDTDRANIRQLENKMEELREVRNHISDAKALLRSSGITESTDPDAWGSMGAFDAAEGALDALKAASRLNNIAYRRLEERVQEIRRQAMEDTNR